MSKAGKINIEKKLVSDVTLLIEESRNVVANTVNTTLVLLYWKIGNRINADILKHKRAEYGKQIIASLTQQLTEKYGKVWDENAQALSPQCGDFYRRDDSLRSAEIIGMDTPQNDHVS